MLTASEGPGSDPAPLSVLLLDDSPEVLAVLREALETDPTVKVVGASGRVPEGIRLAAAKQPQVAVVDVNMPEGGGWAAVRGLREVCPHIRVVGHSAYDDALVTHTMIAAGTSAFVSKGDDLELLLAAIHGEDVMPTESATLYLKHHRRTAVVGSSAPHGVRIPARRSAAASAALAEPG